MKEDSIVEKGDLVINDENALTEWGVSMGDNFIQDLLLPPPMKEFIENESRLEDGKRVLVTNPKVSSRQVTLTFNIVGDSETDYKNKFKKFAEELRTGVLKIEVPALGKEVYKFIYLNSSSFALNRKRTASKLSVKLEEPNPSPEGRR